MMHMKLCSYLQVGIIDLTHLEVFSNMDNWLKSLSFTEPITCWELTYTLSHERISWND